MLWTAANSLAQSPGGTQTGEPGAGVSQALAALHRAFPGVQVHESGGRVRAVFGVPMTQGPTPREAAEVWLTSFASVFGEPELQLAEHSVITSKSGKTVVSYTQMIDGVPVDGSMLKVDVLDSPVPRVTLCTARVALRPSGGLAPAAINSAQALPIAQSHPAAAGLTEWLEPTMTAHYVDAPDSDPHARCVWKCAAHGLSPPQPYDSKTFLIDASTGAVVLFCDNYVSYDVTGTVRAYVTPIPRPLTWPFTASCPTSADELVPLPNLRVRALHPCTGAALYETFTASDGTYTLPVPNSTEVKLEAALVGPYWSIRHAVSSQLVGWQHPVADPETSGSCGSPITVNNTVWNPVFNSSETEYRTAHANTFYHVARTWAYFVDRLVIDEALPGIHEECAVLANLNTDSSPASFAKCNGGSQSFDEFVFFSWKRTSGCTAEPVAFNDCCPNIAYGSWVPHEYSHFISHKLTNIWPPSFSDAKHSAWSEGYADSVAALVNEGDPIYERLSQ